MVFTLIKWLTASTASSGAHQFIIFPSKIINGKAFFVKFFERFFLQTLEEGLLNHFSETSKFLCCEHATIWLDDTAKLLGSAVEPSELKSLVDVLRELGLSYEETVDAMNGVAKEVRSVRHLWKKGNNSRLIKTGLALIAFPEPTPLSETLGAVVLSVGLIQKKMRQSHLGIEDVYNTFQGIMRDLQTIKRGLPE